LATIGRSISHYQILEKLDEGGMGVVYKAKDTHLDRFVAIKVLPPEKVADPERRRRFTQEAKAASALNHPNIITIHDIDEADGVYFISMEFVAGKTLGSLIPRHGMRLGELLKYAIQIADALARAHAAGIIHRDLKPGNIMVTEQGLVKVLDFGLAKLTETSLTSEQDATRTMKPATDEGKIVGTVAYMSPEQAEGKVIGARSDIFSFGSVLYEMLTGRRAFHGDTKASTIAAILREEPKPVSQVVDGLPREMERIVRRALRKDPEQRFQNMADLKVALAEVKEESDSGTLESTKAAPPKRRHVLLWASVMAILLAAVGVWFVRSRTAKPEAALVAVPLTTYPGVEDTPSFSPDGTQVAFSWCPDISVQNCHIYIKQVGVDPPFQLTDKPEMDSSPAWSPDGQTVGFLRNLAPTKAALVLIPQRGGHERVIEEYDLGLGLGGRQFISGPYLAWSPDSKWLICPLLADQQVWALFLISVETGEKRRLTNPPPGTLGDATPAFSPDGHTLAFSRQSDSRSDVYLLRLADGYRPQGEPQKIVLDSVFNFGAAWTPDGRELVFSSGTGTSSGLWRIPVWSAAGPSRLAFASDDAGAPSISRQGNRLAYVVRRYDTNIWRVGLSGAGRKTGNPVPFVSSTKPDGQPSFSLDGKHIAFVSDRSGRRELWICDADGSNSVQLTSLGATAVYGPRWSLDGGKIGFTAVVGPKAHTYSVSAKGGKPRRLIADSAQDEWPYWSWDGRWLYFTTDRSGRDEVWRMPAKGGEAVQMTRNEADQEEESPDGRFIYYSKGWPFQTSLWRMPVEGGEEVKVLDSVHTDGRWTLGREGVYFFTAPDKQGHSDIRLYEFSTGKTRVVLTIERGISEQIAVSPDGRTILYTQLDEAGSELLLVENFR
jgi:serine/threonine protein kinase